MENKDLMTPEPEAKATALPEQIPEFFLIPWEEPQQMMISRTYIKKFFSEKNCILTIDVKLNIDKSIWDNFYEFEIFVKNQGKFLVGVKLTPDYLALRCSCRKMKNSLCTHAYPFVRNRIGLNKFYFRHLYDYRWSLPLASQRSLFKIGVKNIDSRMPQIIVDAIPDLGSIYGYSQKANPTERSGRDIRFRKERSQYAGDRVKFAIPLSNTVNGLPILLPFLSRDGRGALFHESYLLNENLPKPSYLTATEIGLEAACKRLLDLGVHALNSSSSIKCETDEKIAREGEILNLWRELITSYFKDQDVLFFETYKHNWSIKESILRKSYTNQFRKLKIAGEKLKLAINVMESRDGLQMEIVPIYKGSPLRKPEFLNENQMFILSIGTKSALFIDDYNIAQLLFRFRCSDFKVFVLKQDTSLFYEEILRPISEIFHINFVTYRQENLEPIALTCNPTQLLEISILENNLLIKAKIDYGNLVLPILQTHMPTVLTLTDDEISQIQRDFNREMAFREFVKSQHDALIDNEELHSWYLPLPHIAYTNWIEIFSHQCKNTGIDVYKEKIKPGSKHYPHQLRWKLMEIIQKEDFLYLKIVFKVGEREIELLDFKNYLFEKKNCFTLEDGNCFFLSNNAKNLFSPLFIQGRIENCYLVLTSAQTLAFHNALMEIDPKIIDSSVQERRERLAKLEEIPQLPVPSTVQATLRPYQLAGFSWMVFLNEFQWGGLLADDMGLGKTLQVITLLEHFYQAHPLASASLVVVPNSLLFNWQNEYQKFAPNREIVVYYGSNRQNSTDFGADVIVLTTYGTLLSDSDFFAEKSFSYLIMDESQHVKNRNSKRFESLSRVNAQYRIAMTGTPIENGIQDIYSQMSLVNPDFFGNYRTFNKLYKSGTDADTMNETLSNLQKVIQPFILRRTKKQVALDLPEKTETILYMDMTPAQRQVYQKYRKTFQGEVQRSLESKDSGKSKFIAIEALIKLRQICNSPSLLKGESLDKNAVKLDYIDEIMDNVTPGHKVLLFSSFTGMLKLVAERIEERGIEFAYLDGKMSQDQRQNAVQTFQEKESCRVFLISLKAGGTGLNLTAADYVYILDPWWNPAAEAQAIDRCYRIGQDKHVNAYKIVCRDSVEEKILALQEHKKKLADGLILDETNIMKSLTKDELLKLFE